MIAAYEARIEAARMDLAALDRVARLFHPEDGSDEEPIDDDFRILRRLDGISGTDRELWQSGPSRAVRRLGLTGAEAKGSDDENVGPISAPRLTKKPASVATEPARHQAPDEFFYLNWP